MEKFVLYIPNLRELFERKEGLQKQLAQLFSEEDEEREVIHIREENKLHISSVVFARMKFQLISLDLEHNNVTFEKEEGTRGDVNRGIYESLSALQVDFLPKKMSYIMERPSTPKNKK